MQTMKRVSWLMWLWPMIIMLSASAAGLVTFVFPGLVVRPAVVMWFLFVCPGMTVVRFFGLAENIIEWMLALALSFVIDAFIAGIFTSFSEVTNPSGENQSTITGRSQHTEHATICSTKSDKTNAAIRVIVDCSSPTGLSQFSPGISHVDNTLTYPWGNNDSSAIDNVKSLIKQGIPFENTPIMAWGAPDPWPDPSQPEPSNWGYLNGRLQQILQTS